MLSFFQRLLGHTSSKPSTKLKKLGAVREVVRFASSFREPLEVWYALPRGSWALEVAARVGVPRGLVALALADLVRVADEQRPLPEELKSDFVLFGEAFAGEHLAMDVFCEGLIPRMAALIDRAPEVADAAEKLREAELLDRFKEIVELSLVYDKRYAAAHEQMATRVRARIEAEQVRSAWLGRRPSPYR